MTQIMEKLFGNIKEAENSTIFFDEFSYRLAAERSICDAYNMFTVPFLQDIGYLTSPEDKDKLIFLSHLSMMETYQLLRDDFLARHGNGKLNLTKFYEFVVAHKLGYWKKDNNGVTYTQELVKMPGGVHNDLCYLTLDKETQNITVHFDVDSLRKRYEYKLEGKSLTGMHRLNELCNALDAISTPGQMLSLSEMVYRNRETGKWSVNHERLTYSTLLSIGK